MFTYIMSIIVKGTLIFIFYFVKTKYGCCFLEGDHVLMVLIRPHLVDS